MKIHLDGVNIHASTGPNVFASRLTRELLIQGHDVELNDGVSCDVSVVFIEPSGRPLAKKTIQRLDGIWTKPHEFVNRNASIKRFYDSADSVVWQSEFDKTMITKHWGDKKGEVIHNGIEIPQHVDEPPIDIRRDYEHIFVCSANWHRQKRLKENIELFFNLRDTTHPNSALVVMGKNPDCWVTHPSVFYAGLLSHENCARLYRNSDWMIHLAYADHSPNVVCEALAQRCPVICSNIGGTKELVGDFGVIVQESDFNFEPFDYDKPPKLDTSNIKIPERSSLGNCIDLDIKNVAKQYVDLINKIM